MQQVFHTWIWGSFAIPPCRSSPVLAGWMVNVGGQPFFRSLQRCSIGFKSGLWLGHSRTVTELLWSHSFVILAVCLGSFSCWELNLRPSLRSWALWRRFSSGYPCTWPHSSFPRLQPVVLSLQLKTPPQHDAATHHASLLGLYWTGDEQGLVFFLHIPLRIKAKKFYLGLIRPGILLVTILESFRCFSKLHAGFHVSCEERLPSGHSAIKPRLVEGCSDGWLSTTFSHLPNASGAQPQWSLGSSLPLSPRLFSPDSSVWPDGQL